MLDFNEGLGISMARPEDPPFREASLVAFSSFACLSSLSFSAVRNAL